jgi:general secretion pathway protein K
MSHQYTRNGERGIALFAVILAILALSIIAGALLNFSVSSAYRQRAEENATRAQYLALSGIELAAYDVLSGTQIQISQLVKNYTIGGANVVVAISDEAGRIDINLAPPEIMSAAFASTGVPTGDAISLAAAIQDWRDADDTPVPSGAESADYAALGLSYRPRNAPLETIGEIMQVRGMTDAIFACTFRLLTAYAGSADVNLATAQDDVRAVFDWGSTNAWQGYSWPTLPTPDPTAAIQITRSDNSGAVLRFEIEITGLATNEFKFYGIVRLSRHGNAPFELLDFGQALTTPPTCGS